MRRAAVALAALLSVPVSLAAEAADDKVAALKAPVTTQFIVDTVSRAWLTSEWQSYASRFVTQEGRIIDNVSTAAQSQASGAE